MEEGHLKDSNNIVERGYDVMAERYRAWSLGDEKRVEFVERLASLVPRGGVVLDVGCGAGGAAGMLVSKSMVVTGVDLSGKQIELAQQAVPEATFVQGDMTKLDRLFEWESFDGMLALYSIIHLPRELHLDIFKQVFRLLRPNGVFVASLGHVDVKEWISEDWLGAQMYWSHFDSATNQKLLLGAGFSIESAEARVNIEDGAEITFLWIVARKKI